MARMFADGQNPRLVDSWFYLRSSAVHFSFQSGADALDQISVRVIHLQIIASRDRDAIGKHDDVEAARMFGGGILDTGNATRIISQSAQ